MLLVLGCVGAPEVPLVDGPADPGLDPATIPLAGECPLDTRVGGFVVESYEAYAIIDGRVTDGVVPLNVLSLVETAGECSVLRRGNPFCDPACGSDETCDFDGACVPWPQDRDLGTVTLDGLLEPVAMEPVIPGFHYFDTTLPNPPFAAGAVIALGADALDADALDADALDADALALHGVGGPPLVPGEATWSLRTGTDLEVTWDPPGDVRSEIVLELAIDQHGITPASVRCVFVDDGAGLVSGALIDTLRAAGVSGFPSGSLSRRTADRADTVDGCVDLRVGSRRVPDVRVDGVTPCRSTEDCPDGQTCDLELEICE